MPERRGAEIVARLDVSVVVEQQRNDIDAASLNSTMQYSATVVVGSVDVGAMRNQPLDFAKFAVNYRPNNLRIAALVAFVHIRIASNDFDFV